MAKSFKKNVHFLSKDTLILLTKIDKWLIGEINKQKQTKASHIKLTLMKLRLQIDRIINRGWYNEIEKELLNDIRKEYINHIK